MDGKWKVVRKISVIISDRYSAIELLIVSFPMWINNVASCDSKNVVIKITKISFNILLCRAY